MAIHNFCFCWIVFVFPFCIEKSMLGDVNVGKSVFGWQSGQDVLFLQVKPYFRKILIC
jgi:hypothetical protein